MWNAATLAREAHFAREMKLFWGSPPGLAQGGTPWARIWGTPSETSVWLMVGAFYHGMDVAAQGCRVPPSVAQAVQVTVVVMCILSPSDLGVELVCSLCRWVGRCVCRGICHVDDLLAF